MKLFAIIMTANYPLRRSASQTHRIQVIKQHFRRTKRLLEMVITPLLINSKENKKNSVAKIILCLWSSWRYAKFSLVHNCVLKLVNFICE